jgi:thiosulfate/3-mercaptopyruvate sulfurtransferase
MSDTIHRAATRGHLFARFLLPLTLLAGLAAACRGGGTGEQAAATKSDIPTLQPQALAKRLAEPGDKPLLLHVGFKKLYQQAHIPGSEFFGPGSEPEVIARLKQRVADLPRDREIVIYCGCCPWSRCPNVEPAYQAVHALGFTQAKVLFIDDDFGADWVARGYPVSKED